MSDRVPAAALLVPAPPDLGEAGGVTRSTALVVLLLSTLAHAQASAIGTLQPTLPPTNAALADEVTAPEVNPAGLQFIGGPMLIYQHQRNLNLDSIVDGLYFGSTFFDVVGFGVGLDWVRGPYVGPVRTGYRKSSYTFSVGGQWLSAGTSFNVYTPDAAGVPGPNTWDLGLASRPTRWAHGHKQLWNLPHRSERWGLASRHAQTPLALHPPNFCR